MGAFRSQIGYETEGSVPWRFVEIHVLYDFGKNLILAFPHFSSHLRKSLAFQLVV